MQTDELISRFSSDDIIEQIRDSRNDVFQKLLQEDALRQYLKEIHNLTSVSNIKIEFIKRTLKELMLTTVDLSHYGQLILTSRKSGSVSISSSSEKLFYQEIEKAIKNYLL